MRSIGVLIVLATLIAAAPASAHTDQGVAGGLVSGFMHPVSGLDHLLAMASVGIWGAFLRRPLIWTLPVAFPLVMVVGGVLGILKVSLPFVEIGIASSVIALGTAIALAWRAPVAIAVAIIAVFALFHGYAHGAELPTAVAPEAYATGFVLSTGLIHVAGIAVGLLLSLRGGEILLRAAGGLIALAGTYIMAGTLGFA
jgi:urease accessory protein